MNKLKIKICLLLIVLIASLLRLWQLDKMPVSLFGDELDVGYQAYSILTTGKDYTGHFLPLHFRSLADYRTPLYLYSSVPTVAIFGINAWGVRLPAAFFGILTIPIFFLLLKKISQNVWLGLSGALFLAICPWHIHFSRAAFEVTEMLFLFVFGLYAFLIGLHKPRWLILSAICLALTPWAYNTAKLFMPLILLTLVVIYRTDLKALSKKVFIWPIVALAIFLVPFAYSTLFGGGAERFEDIAIWADPTIVPQVGFERLNDQKLNTPPLLLKVFHNPPELLANIFLTNYFQSLSTEFLFNSGDPNPRQGIPSNGLLYRFELILLMFGLYWSFRKAIDRKFTYLMTIWLILSPIPAALTQNGGTHATRLILMLVPITYFISLGAIGLFELISKRWRVLYVSGLISACLISLVLYIHAYWVDYPLAYQEWWQSGTEGAIKGLLSESPNYQTVILSDADVPLLLYFLSWSMYPPEQFQIHYPLPTVNLHGLGQVSQLGKYYFTEIGQSHSLYDLGNLLPDNALYLAPQREINLDLVAEPERLPANLKLIQTIKNPSGSPAFYLLTKNAPPS